MRIQRRYRCLQCSHKWISTSTVIDRSQLSDPACPSCDNQPCATPVRIAAPSIVGTKSRAVDEAYRIAEQDFGLTNMRDNTREGDIAFIPPSSPPPTPSTVTGPAMLWGGAAPSTSGLQMPGQAALTASARGAAAMAKAEDRNPMQMLHRNRPKLQAIPVNRE